jgi:hypothetical protein
MVSRLARIRITYELFFSFAIVASLVIQYTYGFFHTSQSALDYTEQFFSFFTVLSNIFVAVIFAIDAHFLLQGKGCGSKFDSVRGAAIFCIIATGITYSLFLRGPGNQVEYSIPFINQIFHHYVPVVAALDWLFFPPKNRMNWSTLFTWIGITLIYLVLVEFAGMLTHTYPYFFLDPEKFRGYRGILLGSAGFLPFFLVFATFVIGSSKSQHHVRKMIAKHSQKI